MPNDRRDQLHHPPVAAPGRNSLHDWITVWQSELAALGSDREAQENWRAAVAMMAEAMQVMAAAVDAGPLKAAAPEAASGSAGAVAAAGTAAVGIASDAWFAAGGAGRLAGHLADDRCADADVGADDGAGGRISQGR